MLRDYRARLRDAATLLRHTWLRAARRQCLVSAGDSHAAVMSGHSFATFSAHLGPVTMHRAGRTGELNRLLQTWVQTRRSPWRRFGWRICHRRDVLLLHFGEIDVRCHIGRHVSDQDPYDQIQELVRRFIDGVASARTSLECRIVVCAVVPTSSIQLDPEFPVVGELDERVRWTDLMNQELEVVCRHRDVPFFKSGTGPFQGVDGALAADRSDGSVHIAPRLRPIYWQQFDSWWASVNDPALPTDLVA